MTSKLTEIDSLLGAAASAALARCFPVRRCSAEEAADVVRRTKSQFVKNGGSGWWWENFSAGPTRTESRESWPFMGRYVDLAEPCWLIVDDDSTCFPVIETTTGGAELIIGELPFVEFYLVGKQFDWLLAENHHGAIWLLSVPARANP